MEDPLGKFYIKKPVSVEAVLELLSNNQYGLAALNLLLNALEGKLDSADHGLSALKALLDTILVDTETTLENKLDAIDALVDAVEDKLDDGTTGLAALKALIDAIEAKLDNAGYGLEAIYGRIGGASTEATYSLPNDTVENTAFTITPTGAQRITLMLDLTNLVQNADIRIKYDMHGDGAPFPTMETFNWTTGMDDIVYFREISGQRAVVVTVQSTVAQGAVKDIDYEYVLG